MVKIGQRQKDERLQALFDAGKKVYSISKLNTIDQCEYQSYLTYVRHIKGASSCYGILGTRIHDVLEEIMNNKATEDDLLPALSAELQDMDVLGIDFPKDRNGGTSIRDSWISDMTHFCKNYIAPKGKFETEQLFIYKIDEDHYMQGYIDLIRHNADGTISIYDYKTSSNFSSVDLLHHGRQLVLYALAKEQESFKVKNVAWIMLKYAEISFMGKARKNAKKESLIKKICNRSKIVKELAPYIEQDLINLSCNEIDIEIMMNKALAENSLLGLPKEIQEKYTIKPYVRQYELTDEIRQETLQYIADKIQQFESKTDNELEWEPVEITPKTEFFCSVLCGHRKNCKFINDYYLQKDAAPSDDDDDLF